MLINNNPALEVLKAAGLVKDRSVSTDKNLLKEILNDSGLSIDDVIKELSTVVTTSQDEAIKLRGIDTALKLHGVMKEENTNVPNITVVIQASQTQNNGNESEIPSICIPHSVSYAEPLEITNG